MHRIVAAFLVALGAGLVPFGAEARLAVEPSVVELSGARSRTLVTLSNTGADTLYVSLELHSIEDPAARGSATAPVVDPLAEGVLVHPRQMILAPGQRRTARVVFDGEAPVVDRVYRLVLRPFAGEALVDPVEARSAGVRMLLGYKLPLFVRPDRPRADVSLERGRGALRLVNRGNTNVMLRTLEACERDGTRCRALTPDRLHAGRTLPLALPRGLSADEALVRARQHVGDRERLVEYAP